MDLRSDTVTRPTPAMLQAMLSAPLGDDVFGEDPTINELEARLAAMFGKESAVFCPSGSMCNQIALRVHTRPQDQMICYTYAHVYRYEGGGAAANAGLTSRLIDGNLGILSPAEILAEINPDDPHFPPATLVCIENTVNKGGGKCWTLAEMKAVSDCCRSNNLALHLDGARLFNAIVSQGYTTQEIGPLVDTISVCLSKGLGAPVGSVLIGNKEQIHYARRIRKVYGGGMRQAGILAAAGLYALDHHVERLAQDHERARKLASILGNCDWVKSVMPAETNIVIFEALATPAKVLQALEKVGVKAVPFGPTFIRMVTHLDFDDAMLERLERLLLNLNLAK